MMKRKVRTAAPRLDIHGAFVRGSDFSRTSLRGADLSGVEATGVVFSRADFERARLRGTTLRGADLNGATNLTLEQLIHAVIDVDTKLPKYIDRAKPHETASGGRR